MQDLLSCLRERGLVDALTSEDLKKLLDGPLKVYTGFDPTADSLHIGSLVAIVMLRWFQKFGHTPVVILGGATGRIGDPSGKSTERPLLDALTIGMNIKRIRCHFEQVLDFFHPTARPLVFNNDEWFTSYSFVEFLRDVGKHFRVNVMLTKDCVKSRLESDEGISFTEFSYQLLQAYDFYHLFQNHGVTLQMGGSDQWGNIVAGIELVRKLTGKTVYGLTFPLLTKSDGKKFGKTEDGAVWLSKERFSPYQFYQYLYRTSDADVIKLMKMLTFMDMEEIHRYEKEMQQDGYVPNKAQKRLAEELTRLMHDEEGLQVALKVTEAASPGHKGTLDPEVLHEVAKDMPHVDLSLADVIGHKFVDVAFNVGLLSSKGEGARLVEQGGAYLNNEKIEDPQLRLAQEHLIGGEFLLFSAGKKKKILVKVKKI
jgi:tyrosyl-tRNA synthetase